MNNFFKTLGFVAGITGVTIGGLAIAQDVKNSSANVTPVIVENTPQYKKGFDDGQKSKDDQINALKDNLSELTLAKSTLELAREKDLNKIEELNGVIENNQTKIDSLTQEKNTAQEQVNSLTAEKTELQNQVDLLSQDKEANLEQINNLNSNN